MRSNVEWCSGHVMRRVRSLATRTPVATLTDAPGFPSPSAGAGLDPVLDSLGVFTHIAVTRAFQLGRHLTTVGTSGVRAVRHDCRILIGSSLAARASTSSATRLTAPGRCCWAVEVGSAAQENGEKYKALARNGIEQCPGVRDSSRGRWPPRRRPGPGNANDEDNSPFTFVVIGDIPYGDARIAQFPKVIDQINADPAVQFVDHLGDIKSGSSECADGYFQMIKADFDRFVDPLVYTPGGDEWTDCHRPTMVATTRLNGWRRSAMCSSLAPA